MSQQDFKVSRHKVNKNLKMGQSKLYLCGGLPTDWLPEPTVVHHGNLDNNEEIAASQDEAEKSMKSKETEHTHVSPLQGSRCSDVNFEVRSGVLGQLARTRNMCNHLGTDSSDLGQGIDLALEKRLVGQQVEKNARQKPKMAKDIGALNENHSTSEPPSASCTSESVGPFTAVTPQVPPCNTFEHMARHTYPSRKVSHHQKIYNQTNFRTQSFTAHAVNNKHASYLQTAAGLDAEQNMTLNTTCVSTNRKDDLVNSSPVIQETSGSSSSLSTRENEAQVSTLEPTASSSSLEDPGSISITDGVTGHHGSVNEAVWTDPLNHAEWEFLKQYTDVTSNEPFKPINRGEVTPDQNWTHSQPPGEINQTTNKGQVTPEQHGKSSGAKNCNENRSSARVPKTEDLVNCLQALKNAAHKEGLDVVDVHPDGNCLFTAIVDQLRVRGQFYYTPRSLREAAVQQLRAHPTQEDGTPLQEFLTGATWEDYLYCMGQEGEWADHLIISAIPKLLGSRLVILRGATGTSYTILEPDNREPEPPSLKDAGKGITHNPSSPKQIKEDDLVIGHIPEAHYLSLRRRDWICRFSSNLQALDTPCFLIDGTESQIDHTEDRHDHGISSPGFPAPHLNFLMKYIFRARLLLGYRDQFKDFQKKYFTFSMIGDRYSGFATRFAGPNNADTLCCKRMHDSMAVVSVSDTQVVFDDSLAERKDLLALDIHDHPGYLYLRPACPEIWRPALKDEGRQVYLKHLYPVLSSTDIHSQVQHNSFNKCLAFSCQAWPLICEEWMDRRRLAQWPSQDTRELILDTVKVIPTDKANPGPDTVWMYCFGLAEKLLCREMNLIVRKCHGLVCAMFQFALQGDMPSALYKILKSVFLYTCEEIDAADFRQAPGYCIMIILNLLHQQLSDRNVPDYFISERNLVRDLDELEMEYAIISTESLLRHMVGYMFGVFQQHCLPSSLGLQKIYDGLLADAQLFHKHNRQDISWKCFHRLYVVETQEYAKSSDYEKAYYTLRALLQDSSAYTEMGDTESVDVAMSEVLAGLPLQEQWILSFYVDRMQETTILERVCRGRNCMPLEQLFGEQFVQVLTSLCLEYGQKTGSQNVSNLQVPHEILYQENELCFVNQFAKILNCLQYDDAYLSATHFYLKENTRKLLAAIVKDCQESGLHSGHNTAINTLACLYSGVYNTYRNHYQTRCFLDLMDNFHTLSLHINTASNYIWLAELWTYFGNQEKANKARMLGGFSPGRDSKGRATGK